MGKKFFRVYVTLTVLTLIFVAIAIAVAGCGDNQYVKTTDTTVAEVISSTPVVEEKEEVVDEVEYVVDGAIDVSQHQGTIDFTIVDAPIVVVRLGYSGYGNGTCKVDSKFYENMNKLAAYEGEVALYWASHSISTAEVQKENEFIMKELNKLSQDMLSRIDFLFIDREAIHDPQDPNSDIGRADYISSNLFNEVLAAQVHGLQESLPGMTIGVYTNIDYLATKIDTSILGDVPCWIAWYQAPNTLAFDEVLEKTAYYSVNAANYLKANIVMWQYSAKGEVNGITENFVDVNLVSSKMLG